MRQALRFPVALLIIALCVVTLPACDRESSRYCDFGADITVATTGSGGYRGLYLWPTPTSPGATEHTLFRALYSVDEGLFIRSVRGVDQPTGENATAPPQRLGMPCDSWDAVSFGSSDSLVAACGRRPRAAKDQPGTITLYRLEGHTLGDEESQAGGVHSFVIPGALIGEGHAGLSLAARGATPNEGVELAYHDGRSGHYDVWHLALFFDDGEEDRGLRLDEPTLLSATVAMAGQPSLYIEDDVRYVTWAEGWVEPSTRFDDYAGQIMLQQSDLDVAPVRPARRIAQIHHHPSQPTLVGRIGPEGDRGAPTLLFRDLRPPKRRPGLFAMPLNETIDEPTRVGRSNGPAAPHGLHCGDSLVTTTARTFGRTDVLIGIHLLDEQLEDRVAEQQVYEWSAQFADAAPACATPPGNHDTQDAGESASETLWLLVGERHRLGRRSADLHLLSLRCR